MPSPGSVFACPLFWTEKQPGHRGGQWPRLRDHRRAPTPGKRAAKDSDSLPRQSNTDRMPPKSPPNPPILSVCAHNTTSALRQHISIARRLREEAASAQVDCERVPPCRPL